MDFFQFASFMLNFFMMSDTPNPPNRLWVCLVVGALCFLIVYIFQAVGLFVIAKRERYPHKWMIFIPFFNTYYIGVCAQKNKIYNVKAKNFALAAAIIEVVLVVGYILYFVAAFKMWDYLTWMPEYFSNGEIAYYVPESISGEPENLYWLAWIFANFNNLILSLADLVFIVIKMLLLMAFFRTYATRYYLAFSIVGAFFPLAGILIYAVRNNAGISYMDYVNKMREQSYRMYQQQYGNPYNNNPYNQGGQGGYSGQGGAGYNQTPDTFGEYGSSSGSSGGSPYDTTSNGGGSSSQSDGGNSSGGGNASNGGSSSDSPFDEFN